MKKLTLAALRFYKRWISPMMLPSCRFQPTCSDYGAEAIARHGVMAGFALTGCRLLRCNPFSRGGFDPVPLHTCTHPSLIPGRHD
jgi:uncharacterized protein